MLSLSQLSSYSPSPPVWYDHCVIIIIIVIMSIVTFSSRPHCCWFPHCCRRYPPTFCVCYTHYHDHCYDRHYDYRHDQQQDHCMTIAILAVMIILKITMNHHHLRRSPWRQNASRNYHKGRSIHPFLSHHTLNNKHGEDNDDKNTISDGCSIVVGLDGW